MKRSITLKLLLIYNKLFSSDGLTKGEPGERKIRGALFSISKQSDF